MYLHRYLFFFRNKIKKIYKKIKVNFKETIIEDTVNLKNMTSKRRKFDFSLKNEDISVVSCSL
jgi:hypothetical protein